MNRSIKLSGIILCLLVLVSCTKKSELQIDDILVEEYRVLDENVKPIIPHIYINIDGAKEVVDKEIYLQADITIEGKSMYPDLDNITTSIKGRGNSTWAKPKKPYRLKLDKKSSILGLPTAKNWVLLANHQDYTLMTNAIAMKIGKQLGLPFTNDIIPVDLTINGVYRGNYNLTQQVEIHENRVNVGDDGILWELDSYFDEDWKFRSAAYKLLVMVKDPDMESSEQFDYWKTDFLNLENLISDKKFPNNAYGSLFDKQQFVNFILVNMLVGNREILHPKSTFIHKTIGGKYTMGPLWDFDFGFGFSEEDDDTYFHYANTPLLRDSDSKIGAVFYNRLLKDPEVKSIFMKTWNDYKSTKFDDLMNFIEEYAARIRESQKRDFEIWRVGNNDHAKNKAEIKEFLRKRHVLITKYAATFSSK